MTRGGLRPFRAGVKDIHETRQSLQHLSAEVGEAVGAATWNIVGPVGAGDHEITFGDLIIVRNNSPGVKRVLLPLITPESQGLRVCVKTINLEGIVIVVGAAIPPRRQGGAAGRNLIEPFWQGARGNRDHYVMNQDNIARGRESLTFISDGLNAWHIMGAYWHKRAP